MPPGDSLNEYGSGKSGALTPDSDIKMEEQDWESRMMAEARAFKTIADELKRAGCPLFGGRYCTKLSQQNREKAGRVEDRVDAFLGTESASASPFKAGTRDELRLFLAQGDTLMAFKQKMKELDFSMKCNAVWSSDAIAYRCNTCAHNPCMSLCAECFQNSDHTGHDFNRFFSQAGGACDCGNGDVLRESGFCPRHGPNANRPSLPSNEMVSLAEFGIPKLFVRLFLFFRGWSGRYEQDLHKKGRSEMNKETFSNHLVAQAHLLIQLLQELVDCGGPIRDAIADILLDQQLYADLNKRSALDDLQEVWRPVELSLDWRSRGMFEEDIKSLQAVEGSLSVNYSMNCLLDELVFWMIRLVFPQSIINLCLSMLSHPSYRDWFAKQFFSLYACVAEIMVGLARTESNATIYAVSSRVIHISVQILSSEAMCVKLDEQIGLKKLLIWSTLGLLSVGVQRSFITQSPARFYASEPPIEAEEGANLSLSLSPRWTVYSVEVNQPLRKHTYWTLVSDMQNLLGHATIALGLLNDPDSLQAYTRIVALMQGMNINFRVVSGDHVEYDTAQPYQLSFHLEWEVSALNMFNTLSAITDQVNSMHIYLNNWKELMKDWLLAIEMSEQHVNTPPFSVSYHIPLHRHIAAGVLRCMECPSLQEPLVQLLVEDPAFLRMISLHPIRIQVCRAETSAGMWTRNGNAARNQSFYYAQTNYNTAFLDCDITLLRFTGANVNAEWFIKAISTSFYLHECLWHGSNPLFKKKDPIVITRKEWVESLIDGALRLLLELVVVPVLRSERETIESEVVAALAIGDLTHSKLKAEIPEKGTRPAITDHDFDTLLAQLTRYTEPDQGSHIQQGVYRLSEDAWCHRFEPVFCRMRATTAREFNDALLRAENIERSGVNRATGSRPCGGGHTWIPYRLVDFNSAKPQTPALGSIYKLLVTPSFFHILYEILDMVKEDEINDTIVQQVVYLLTLSVSFISSAIFSTVINASTHPDHVTSTSPFDQSPFLHKSMPCGISIPSFHLSFFMFQPYPSTNEPPPSLLSQVLRILRWSLNEGDSNADLDKKLATVLREQMALDSHSLTRISGAATQYIGRFVNLLYHCDSEARSYLNSMMDVGITKDSPPKSSSQLEDPEAKSIAEKRLASKRRQQALLAAHKKKSAALMQKMMLKEGLSQSQMDAMDTTQKSEVRHYECPICGDTTASTLSHPVGSLVSIVTNYAVEHSLPANKCDQSLLERDAETMRNNGCMPETNMMKHCDVAKRMLLEQRFPVFADLVQLPTGVEVRACGHFAHMKCYKAYVQTLWDSPSLRVNPLDARIDVSCPMCRAPVHGLLPLAPDIDTECLRRADKNETLEDCALKRNVIAVRNSLKKTNPPLQESDKENLIRYRQSLTNFIMRCEKWTSYRGDVGERLRAKGQTFTLGLAKANCERNVLLSELDIEDRSSIRQLPTEHLISAARYEGTERDVTFANFQWRHLTYGCDVDECSMNTLPNSANATLDVSDSEVLASSSTAAKQMALYVGHEVESDAGTPVLMFDMKSALTRLSLYVITNDSFLNHTKTELLSFIYSTILWASMVRSAVLVSVRLPLPQMKRIIKLNTIPYQHSNHNQVMSNVALSVITKLFSLPHVNADDLLIENTDDVDIICALNYAALDLARYTAELWHECRIKQLSEDIRIGHASFDILHQHLTGNDELSSNCVPSISLNRWVDVISRWIPYTTRVLKMEALVWRRFTLLELPPNYDDVFTRFFGRACVNCTSVPRNPVICLLCSQLVCLDNCCLTSTSPLSAENELQRHAVQCGSGVACFLSLNTSLIVVVTRHKAALWGSVYLDAHGEEDRNLKRGKPLFLSQRRFLRLRWDWIRQSHNNITFFSFEHLPALLRDAHYVYSL